MRCLFRRSSAVVWTVCLFVVLILSSPLSGLAAERGSLHGTVSDPLGAIVPGAKVELLNGTTVVKTTTTDGAGNYAFDIPENARYSVRAVAPTFQNTTSESIYVTKSTKANVDITLATQTLTQQISVTASATPTPIAQIGASVTVLTADD
jgi:iron complex outermembrane receptor protein/vitamin B12 transporter